MASGWQKSLYDKVLSHAIEVNPVRVRAASLRHRDAAPEQTEREIAERLVQRYAAIAFVEGALTTLASGPALALPAGLFDAAFLMRASSRLNGLTGHLADPSYLDTDDWKADVLTIVGDTPVAHQALRRSVVQMVHRVGVRVASRRIAARALPVVGGLVGGAWNYLEMRQLGRRFVEYHFGDRRTAVPPADVTEHIVDLDDATSDD